MNLWSRDMMAKQKPAGKRSRGLILTEEARDLLDRALRIWWESPEAFQASKARQESTTGKLTRQAKAEGLDVNAKTADNIYRHEPVDAKTLEHVFKKLNISPPFSKAEYCVLAPSPSGNVPYIPTSCIGRKTQVAEIKALLEVNHLVTLTGAGGVGKTRLAVAVAEAMQICFADGIWFLDLAGITDPAMVTQTVASALGVQEEKDRPLLQTLAQFLRGKPLLLLLDNCEHLLDACALLVDHLITSSSALRVLATSRERLNILSEHPYPVPSLPAPDLKRLSGQKKDDASMVRSYDSVRLFVERARLQCPGFRVTAQNALRVASICHRLDGIPLAIELAAARVPATPLDELERGLNDCFHLLTGGSRAALPRQQTLRATMDWSYNLLEEPEKTLLCRLSVFRGGWELEAATSVCASDDMEAWEVLDLLISLIDQSLVVFEEQEGQARYRMLETVRQYAAEKLLASGESEEVQGRHRDYFLALAEEAEPKLKKAEQGEWLQRLKSEYANLRAALHWTLSQRNASAGLRFCGSLCRFWESQGYLREGREWCAQVLAISGAQEQTPERAKTLYGAGYLAYYQADYAAARDYLEQSRSLCEEIAEWRVMAGSLIGLGIIAANLGDIAGARSLYEQSRMICEEIADRRGIARALNGLGGLVEAQGDYAAALALFKESSLIFREIGDRSNLANTLKNLGGISYYLRDYTSARAYLEESRSLCEEISDWRFMAYSLSGLGNVAQAQGDILAARRYYEESLGLCRELGQRNGVAYVLVILGSVAESQSNYREAWSCY